MRNPLIYGLLRLTYIWSIGLFLSCSLIFQGVLGNQHDTPDIPLEIDLKAPWETHPFVLDVLEAIAAENPQAYFTTVSAFATVLEERSSENLGQLTDKETHDFLLEHALKTNSLTEEQIAYVELSLASHRYSALIEAQYQYFKIWSGAEVQRAASAENCENVFVYNNEVSCDTDTVFALKTVTKADNSNIELLPTDRLIGARKDAPIAVLYADLESESFGIFHTHLISAALQGKIQYILRYKPLVRPHKSERETLTGYGVELNLKRTDYLVIDDRSTKKDDKNEQTGEPSQYEQLREATSKAALDKNDIPMLGYKAANYVLSSDNPTEALINVTLDFPKYAKIVSQLESEKGVAKDVLFNTENRILGSGQNAILINGAPAFTNNESPFDLLDALDRERTHIKKLMEFGFEPSIAADLIMKNLVGDALDESPLQRYDYRTESLIWLNDIEKDPRFSSWSTDINELLEPLESPGQLHPIRHNINSLVFALDITDPAFLNTFIQSTSLVSRGIPIQLGIIPLVVDDTTEEIAKHLYYLYKYAVSANPKALQTYLSHLLSQVEAVQAFRSALQVDTVTFETILSDLSGSGVQSAIDQTKQWMSDFDVEKSSSMLTFANGVLMNNVKNILMEASFVFSRDLQEIRKLIASGSYTYNAKSGDEILRDRLISGGLKRRNAIINPPEGSPAAYVDITEFEKAFEEAGLSVPSINSVRNQASDSYTTVWLLGDLDNDNTLQQLLELFKFMDSQETQGFNLRVKVVPTSENPGESGKGSNLVSLLNNMNEMSETERVDAIRQFLHPYDSENLQKVFNMASHYGSKLEGRKIIEKFTTALKSYPTFSNGLHVIFAGRHLDIPSETYLTDIDLEMLFAMEQKRIGSIVSQSKEYIKSEG
ncbi:hypothetical protein AWJ20_1534 [Sugiyamaella lignohabitans]|uniref:Uncharacterized protein n=1 Tax=Sugiyamaella lignohabitans TaxID=796027 RepID=A0A167DSU1_9ASCO|nr:uncharacterized protein AWJ20_1534 [Sugiyamaella lignohabitans]ANB13252.1 hypothetical protein AWJ20_1534 [Sugiyamaella lignohabitans]